MPLFAPQKEGAPTSGALVLQDKSLRLMNMRQAVLFFADAKNGHLVRCDAQERPLGKNSSA